MFFLSDEAIVAVFTHEVFEIEEFREAFLGYYRHLRMPADDYEYQRAATGYPDNFHCKAWDAADKAVRAMRARRNP